MNRTLQCISYLVLVGFSASIAFCAEPGLIQIGGEKVRWFHEGDEDTVIVTYAFVTASIQTPHVFENNLGTGEENCHLTQSVDAINEHTELRPHEFERKVRLAFDVWEAKSPLRFKPVATESAQILIGAQAEPWRIAHTNLHLSPSTGSGTRAIEQAIVCFNPELDWTKDLTLDHVLTHEFGHAIGLDHSSNVGHVMSFQFNERYLTCMDIRLVQMLYEESRMSNECVVP